LKGRGQFTIWGLEIQLLGNHRDQKLGYFANAVGEYAAIPGNVFDLSDIGFAAPECTSGREALTQPCSILCYIPDMTELAHPSPNMGCSQMESGCEEVRAMITELRVAECEKFIVTITDRDSVCHGSFDSGVNLILGIPHGRKYSTYALLVCESNAEKVIYVFDIAANDPIRRVNRGSVVVDRRWSDLGTSHEGTVRRNLCITDSFVDLDVENLHGIQVSGFFRVDMLQQSSGVLFSEIP
jgi:hypothetical protein